MRLYRDIVLTNGDEKEMKTTFESELHKIFDEVTNLYDKKYVGRAFYAKIDTDLNFKAEYISTEISGHYDALRFRILQRNGGELDANTIRFSEIWGNKKIQNRNFPEGVSPHLWNYDGKLEWYVYQPTDRDFDEITMQIMDYVDVFQEQSEEQTIDEMSM